MTDIHFREEQRCLCRVRCSELHGPGVILVGDAAHAVTPIGGQGCNAALEDGSVLEAIVSKTGVHFGVFHPP